MKAWPEPWSLPELSAELMSCYNALQKLTSMPPEQFCDGLWKLRGRLEDVRTQLYFLAKRTSTKIEAAKLFSGQTVYAEFNGDKPDALGGNVKNG